MKPAFTALVAIAALIVGGLVGYLAGHTTPAPTPTGVQGVEAGALDGPEFHRPAGSRPDTPPEIRQPVERPPAPVHDPIRPVGPSSSGLALWIAANADIRVQPGTERIWGQVKTQTGEALPGATIKLWARNPGAADNYGDEGDVESQIEAQARRTLFSESSRASAVTDTKGRYEFNNLGDYDYQVTGEASGYRLRSLAAMTRNGTLKPSAEVNFTAEQVCEVEFDVLMPDGSHARSAYLHYRSGTRGGGSTMWTPMRRTIQPGEGTYNFHATRGDDEELASDAVEIEMRLGVPVERRILQLKEMASIVCVVKQPEGEFERGYPGNRIRVVLEPNPRSAAPESIPSGGETRSEDLWRGPGGSATFSRLTAGTYRLVLAQGNRVVVWKDVIVTSGVLRETLAPPEPEARDFLIVRVRYSDGKPVTGANLRAEYSSSGGGDMRGRMGLPGFRSGPTVVAKPEGEYWVEKPGKDNAQPEGWVYCISGNAREYGSFTHVHPGDGAPEALINLPAPAHLTLYFTGASTHPQKDRIQLQLMVQTSPNSWSGVDIRGGSRTIGDSMKFGPIAPGTYRLTLRLTRRDVDDGMPWDSELAALQFEVHPGENSQTCAVPMIHKLTLLIPDPKAVPMLQLNRADGSQRRHLMRMQITERMVIDGLAAGDWIITSRDEGMKVNLNRDLEVTYAPKSMDCAVLDIVKPGGKIEALGLRQGDKVLVVDGESAQSARDIMRQMGACYQREATTWTIQRAGQTFNVTFSGTALGKAVTAESDERENFSFRPSLKD